MDNPDFLLRKDWLSGGETGKQERQNMERRFDDTRSWVDPNGYKLSDRLWNAGDADRRQIDRIIKDGISRGLHPLQMTAALEAHLTPEGAFGDAFRPEGMARVTSASGLTRTPYVNRGLPNQRSVGKGNYAARRLARTEVSRAYNETARLAAMDNPFVESIRYALSPSHPEPDICDTHAKADPNGDGPGIYPKNTTKPSIPAHPQCLCHWEPYSEDVNLQDVVNRLRGDLGKPPIKQLPDGSWQLPTGTQPPLPGTPTAPASVGSFLKSPEYLAKRQAVDTAKKELADARKEASDLLDEWLRLDMNSAHPDLDFNNIKTRSAAYDEKKRRRDVADANYKASVTKVKTKLAELEQSVNDFGDVLRRESIRRIDQKVPGLAGKIDALNAKTAEWNTHRNALAKMNKNNKNFPGTMTDNLRVQKEWLQIEAELNQHAEMIRATNREVLGEVRPMGSTTPHPLGNITGVSKKAAQDWVDSASKSMPVDWWEASVGQSTKRPMAVAKSSRGSYGGNRITLNTNETQSVAAHEMQHRMDGLIPGLSDLRDAHWQRRAYPLTENDVYPIKKVPGYEFYSSSEKTVLDNFVNPYTGKRYDFGDGEVNTMGVQSALGDDYEARIGETVGDHDLWNHVLGMVGGM